MQPSAPALTGWFAAENQCGFCSHEVQQTNSEMVGEKNQGELPPTVKQLLGLQGKK